MTRTGSHWLVGGLIVGVLFAAPIPQTFGQVRQNWGRNNNRQQPSGPPVDVSGTVEAVMPGYIKLTAVTGQVWVLQIDPAAKVKVLGKAKTDFLRPGLIVSFVADVDKRHSSVEEKITKLSLVTPSELYPIGAAPALDGGGAGGGGASTERFNVIGQFGGVNRKGKATVVVQNQYFKPNLTVEIADDADIKVDLTDPKAYTFAKQGDKVEAKGKQLSPTTAIANDLTITLAEPLTSAAPEKEKKPVARRTTRSKKGDDAEEAADGKNEEMGEKGADRETRKREPRKPSRTAGKRGEGDDDAAGAMSEEKPAGKADRRGTKAEKAASGGEKAGTKAAPADKEEQADEGK